MSHEIDAAKTTAAGEATPEEALGHVTPWPVYVAVYVALLALTALTCGIAYVHLGLFNNIVAVGIAIAKGSLVILFFMHVKWSPRLIPLAAVAGFFWLIHMFGGTFADYFTRAWISLPVPR